jgi:hypothetical protein
MAGAQTEELLLGLTLEVGANGLCAFTRRERCEHCHRRRPVREPCIRLLSNPRRLQPSVLITAWALRLRVTKEASTSQARPWWVLFHLWGRGGRRGAAMQQMLTRARAPALLPQLDD